MKYFKKTDFIIIAIAVIVMIFGLFTGNVVDKVFSSIGIIFMMGCGVLALIYGDHKLRKNKKNKK